MLYFVCFKADYDGSLNAEVVREEKRQQHTRQQHDIDIRNGILLLLLLLLLLSFLLRDARIAIVSRPSVTLMYWVV